MTRPSAVPPPVTAVLDASSTWLPARLGEVEELLREQAGGHGELLAGDAGATLAAGGKRLRPLLVLLCAGPEGAEAAVRAAAAVELVHMATLVHDDVLDAADLRRGRPTVVATSGRAARRVDRRPALLARLRGARRRPATRARSSCSPRASVSLARGELAQRQDAYDTSISEARYLERCRLKTGGAVRVRRAAWAADSAALGALRRRRSASPSSSSTTSSTSPGRPSGPARRAAPTCSTAPSPCR